MAKSGLTFEASKGGNLAHNNREHPIDYLIDGNYFCDRTETEALSYLQSLRQEAQKNYTARTGQRMQIDVNDNKYLWSASINLNKEHTLQDVQNLAKALDTKYGWQPIQIAVHQDEGKPDGTRKNLHAHIEFFMVRKEGTTAFKKKEFRQKQMSELQTFVADFLKMERGEIYKETGNYKKHLKPNAYKAKVRELEELAQQLQRAKETKEEHEKTEEKQEYNFREMQKYITSLEELTTEQKKELHRLNTQVRKNEIDLKTLESTVEILKSKNEALHEEMVKKNEIIDSVPNTDDVMTQVNDEAREILLEEKVEMKRYGVLAIVKFLKEKYFQLKDIIKNLKAENEVLRTENLALKEQNNGKLSTKELLVRLRDKSQELADSADRIYSSEPDAIADSMDENSEYIPPKAYRTKN